MHQREDDETVGLIQKTQTNQQPHTEAGPVINESLLSPRAQFIRKVYTLLTFQLALTAAFTIFVLGNETAKVIVLTNIPIMILAVVVLITSLCALFCYHGARKVPSNYIWMILFTISEAYFVAAACAMTTLQYENGYEIIFMALMMTVILTVGLTIYAFYCKEDFTPLIGILWVVSIAMFIFAIFLLFTDNHILHILYCVLAIILYGIYLIVDTQLIIGGKRYELSLDDYILGCCILYIDIIMLFLELLKLLAEVMGKK